LAAASLGAKMNIVERIMVAVDGAASGEAAVRWTVERAKATPASIEVTTVYVPMPSESVLAGNDFRAVYARLLEETVARIESAVPGVAVTAALRTGQSRTELTTATAEADLFVIGTGSSEAGLHGVLPIRIASAAHCPVVVVPAAWEPAGGVVMVGLESTEQEPRVVDFAAGEARRANIELTVVHTWSVPTIIAVAMFAHPGVWRSMLELHSKSLAATMDHVRRVWPDVDVHQRLKEGSAARILAEDARGAALLVVGRREHATVGDAVLGTTSHDLLIAMPCPVVVVPE
jgi:nucleotide-binding universal stress UspA family protein